MTVLIHFEGWNARYDEWLEMTSDRLRPLTRTSVKKDHHQKGLVKVEMKKEQVKLVRSLDNSYLFFNIFSVICNGLVESNNN